VWRTRTTTPDGGTESLRRGFRRVVGLLRGAREGLRATKTTVPAHETPLRVHRSWPEAVPALSAGCGGDDATPTDAQHDQRLR
jgi:hypothetical protein